jgi:glycosyltransferase involved in cell wall biosynthesis
MDNKVLVISYFYPPYISPGAIRASKYAKYLPEYGWTPLVVTADKNDYLPGLPLEICRDSLFRTHQFDINGIAKLFFGSNGSRTGEIRTYRGGFKSRFIAVGRNMYANIANFPDGQIGWYPYAKREGLRIIRNEKPRVIFSTSSPTTDHLIAYRLKRNTGLPWIAELRDLWTQNHNYQRAYPLNYLEKRLEKHVLNAADAVVTVSEPWAEELRRRVHVPVHVISNGFDSSDYPTQVPLAKPFTISYTGILYEGNQDPVPLFDAIAAMNNKGLISPGRVRLRFIGRYVYSVLDAAKQRGISEYIEIRETVSREEALRLQAESALLLVLSWNGAQRFGWVGLKLYEYFGSGRPVLAIGPKDCGASVLTAQFHAGFVADKTQEVEAILLKALTEFESKGDVLFSPDVSGLRRFERCNLTGELASILTQVAKRMP